MRSAKRIVRQEWGIVLLETTVGQGVPHAPARVTYSVRSEHTPKINYFDDLTAAMSCFDDTVTRRGKTSHPTSATAPWATAASSGV